MRAFLTATCSLFVSAAPSLAGVILADGDMDSLAIGTRPDRRNPNGAWGFPPNYISGLAAEPRRRYFTTVDTSTFDPSRTGNSLQLRVGDPINNMHLPNLFTQVINESPGEVVRVTFDLWVADLPLGGGSIYVGGDHGGGGFSNATDRGPQLTWLADGSITQTDGAGVQNTIFSGFVRDDWQTVQIDIDLNADTFDIALSNGVGQPLTSVGAGLGFRSNALSFLDRFTFVNFTTTPISWSYLDNVSVSVIPEPTTLALLLVGAAALSARRRN